MPDNPPKINPMDTATSLHRIAVLCEKFEPFADKQDSNVPSRTENTVNRASDTERHSINPTSGA
ncbi:MAG: hypothetical protein A3C55_03295 [Gammaproteobacteria bacterium RIFCSPHIGHO2_02_FULL_42_13]|nr:MAG: hypothetical protein A3C55_03295 [Gammaproteobacteria bacterium RIFCSPHIGHO2_02_FULL_42_13]